MNDKSQEATAHGREFDVVVFGASGFVGSLTAQYLAEHAPQGVRVALAGRSESRLAEARKGLPDAAQNWPLIVADANTQRSLDSLVSRTRVICTTVGPYLRYGKPLLLAAAKAGTDYVDLTAEVPFVHFAIEEAHEIAEQTGARIVHSCGLDSVPSDLGVHLLYERMRRDGAGALTDTTMVVKSMRGGASGGSVDTLRVLTDQSEDPAIQQLVTNPHALSGSPGITPDIPASLEPSDLSIIRGKRVDPSLRGTLAPFLMASYNTRIVRRSNALLGNAYGDGFHYAETMAITSIPGISGIAAKSVYAATTAFASAMGFGPTRWVLDKILPKPGDGPSRESQEKGYLVTQTFTKSTAGRRYRSQVTVKGDPGYVGTAVMLGESALALALDRDRLPKRFGVLTPAVAMGAILTKRLQDAGFELNVTELH
ncbi:trans-acting enoyl reductase family protein [Alcanivorax sp. DG881]|jgi:short subunit dehydrogenase-like uncharacterized protein|uniref:saccharopine dehydrogenase family protein n=1 Tax=Alcanivorax sp. DG881 TaxID=236097 RepID=UPI00017EC8E1|nr:saccharopine dehydrogenase NADP-binding domain-containing protein [Alcanivorax sp. DG881]EDX90682.1 saccharopine dehydrogenase [Alcanivorax sp. DG881]